MNIGNGEGMKKWERESKEHLLDNLCERRDRNGIMCGIWNGSEKCVIISVIADL